MYSLKFTSKLVQIHCTSRTWAVSVVHVMKFKEPTCVLDHALKDTQEFSKDNEVH